MLLSLKGLKMGGGEAVVPHAESGATGEGLCMFFSVLKNCWMESERLEKKMTTLGV